MWMEGTVSGCDHMVVGFTTTYPVPNIANVVSSNHAQAKCTRCIIM